MTDEQARVIELLARHARLGERRPEPHEPLKELGLDSLRFLLFLVELEKMLGRRVLRVSDIGRLSTVADLLRLVSANPTS